MTPIQSVAGTLAATPLRIAAWTWFGAGCAALLLFPGARAHDATFGWLPFWLVVAPLLDILLLHRSRLMAMPRALLVRARHRRWPPRRQARRRRLPQRRARLRPLLAALLSQ
jgi:hypothetical protein